MDLQSALEHFTVTRKFLGKGPLCVALVVTRHAQQKGLPLNQNQMVTEGGGQVLGLGKGAVQAILERHGITKVLASEGGRTSRGSIGKMQQYVAFLNTLANDGPVNLVEVEKFWIERVRDFFAAKPFKFRLDNSKSLRTVVRDVLRQAEERQKSTSGTQYVGAVMQHLIGAKLDCALGQGAFEHNSFSTSDAQTGRASDFFIGDVAIHVTTSPSEALIHRFQENIDEGYRPVLVTRQKGLPVADVLAENAGIADRVDMFEVEQFIALNLYELARFAAARRKVVVSEVIARYNEIIDTFETDPSLKIELN